jgi:hypothetical protein
MKREKELLIFDHVLKLYTDLGPPMATAHQMTL